MLKGSIKTDFLPGVRPKLGAMLTSNVFKVFEWVRVCVGLGLNVFSIVASPDSSLRVARSFELLAGATKKDLIDYQVVFEFLPYPSSLFGLALAASDLLFSSTI